MTFIRRFFTAVLAVCAVTTAETPSHPAVAMISIDGMHPDYLLQADKYGLKIPNLRRILAEGAHATSVRGVLPTVTYPSHTTLLTGVWPAKHGIYNNVTFDPLQKNAGGWYWYSDDIRVPTLWQAADRAGYTVGSVSWPVSVGAHGVRYNVPEYWRAMTPDDLKLLRALASPGLVAELLKVAGPYTVDLNDAIPGDWGRTRFATTIIRQHHVNFMTLHLAALDHLEHAAGPFSPEALNSLEEIDKMVADVQKAIRTVDPKAIVCVVSDHGFARIDQEFEPGVAFVKAGLITLKSPGVADWVASPWGDGGSSAVVLKNPSDEAARTKTRHLLESLAADPANGINAILDEKQIAALGGSPGAAFWIDMKPGFASGTALEGPQVRPSKQRGTHGYSPMHPELRTSFFIAGPGIPTGTDLGDIDMRSVAPTVAKIMGLTAWASDLKPLSLP